MKVVILGIGNYAEPMIELCIECGHSIQGLYHFNKERTGEKVLDYEILGDYQDFIDNNNQGNVVVAVGNNKIRNEKLNFFRDLGYYTISLIHPTAYVSNSAILGTGVYIHARAFVWTKTQIANNVIISPNAMVAHHVKIGEGCLISANSMVGSYVNVKERVMIGINAGIVSKALTIGSDAIIGANSMVINNVEPNDVMVGTPSKSK